VANNVIGTAGNVIENAGGVLNKFKEFGIRPTTPGRKNSRSKENYDVEEVDFAKAPQPSHNNDQVTDSHNEQQGISDGATRKGGKESEVSQTIEAGDLFAFLDDDVEDKTEIAKKKFEELLSESTSKRDVSDYFTIDDDDLL
jgi:hypothetical protein